MFLYDDVLGWLHANISLTKEKAENLTQYDLAPPSPPPFHSKYFCPLNLLLALPQIWSGQIKKKKYMLVLLNRQDSTLSS